MIKSNKRIWECWGISSRGLKKRSEVKLKTPMERWVSLRNLERFNRGCKTTLIPDRIRSCAQIRNLHLLLHYQARRSGIVRKVALARTGASASVLVFEKGRAVVAQNVIVSPRYSWSMTVTLILCPFRCSFLTYLTSRPIWPSMAYKLCKCSHQLSSPHANVKIGPTSSFLWTSKCPLWMVWKPVKRSLRLQKRTIKRIIVILLLWPPTHLKKLKTTPSRSA